MKRALFQSIDSEYNDTRFMTICPFCRSYYCWVDVESKQLHCTSCDRIKKITDCHAELEEEDPFLEFKGKIATLENQITELQNYMTIMRRECQKIKDRLND